MNIISLQNRHLFECNIKEREGLLEEVKLMIMLTNKVKKEDIYALENELDSTIKDNFLKWGIMLMVDGVDLEIFKSMMEKVIICSGKTGVELLRRIIQMEGLICIQRGFNPRILEETLVGLLGEDVLFGDKAREVLTM